MATQGRSFCRGRSKSNYDVSNEGSRRLSAMQTSRKMGRYPVVPEPWEPLHVIAMHLPRTRILHQVRPPDGTGRLGYLFRGRGMAQGAACRPVGEIYRPKLCVRWRAITGRIWRTTEEAWLWVQRPAASHRSEELFAPSNDRGEDAGAGWLRVKVCVFSSKIWPRITGPVLLVHMARELGSIIKHVL